MPFYASLKRNSEILESVKRFFKRRARLKDTCLRLGHPVVNEFSEIVPSHFYFPNTLFDDRSLDMSGCILPRTGVSGWNSFWFGSSEFDKTGRFSSFQAQVGLFLLKNDKIDGFCAKFEGQNLGYELDLVRRCLTDRRLNLIQVQPHGSNVGVSVKLF